MRRRSRMLQRLNRSALADMRSASALGANLVIQSALGEGTQIILTLNRNHSTP